MSDADRVRVLARPEILLREALAVIDDALVTISGTTRRYSLTSDEIALVRSKLTVVSRQLEKECTARSEILVRALARRPIPIVDPVDQIRQTEETVAGLVVIAGSGASVSDGP